VDMVQNWQRVMSNRQPLRELDAFSADGSLPGLDGGGFSLHRDCWASA
jgi:hypothetical protein